MISEKVITRYFLGSFAYGFVRKVGDVYDAKLHKYEYDSEKREHYYKPYPMLLTDKAAVVTLSTLFSPFWLPVYLYNDVSRLEIYMRKSDPTLYGYDDIKRSTIHYLF